MNKTESRVLFKELKYFLENVQYGFTIFDDDVYNVIDRCKLRVHSNSPTFEFICDFENSLYTSTNLFGYEDMCVDFSVVYENSEVKNYYVRNFDDLFDVFHELFWKWY